MKQSIAASQITPWLESAARRLTRALERSAPSRIALLAALNISGCLLMLSPIITLVLASASAFYSYSHVQGPLDLFLIEVLATVALLAAVVTWQLWTIRPASPPGYTLEQARQAGFHAMVERRLRHFGKVSVDAVKLTMAAELRITTTPAWPVPLFHTNTLCIGAPLLFFIDEANFKLALAGAVAAGARTTGGARGWIAQASRDWAHITAALERRRTSLAAKLFLRPARRLATLTRALDGDLRSERQRAQCGWMLGNSGEQAVSGFLAALIAADSFLANRYWPMVLKAAEHCPEPVVHPFSHFGLLLRNNLTMDAAQRSILQAQAGRNASFEGMRDLLAELDLDQLSWSGIPETPAYDTLFEDAEPLQALDALWQRMAAPEWKKRHTRFQKQKKRFEQLQEKARQQILRGDSAINFVTLASRFLDTQQAVSVYRAMYANNADNASLCFVCGQQMLAAGLAEEAFDLLHHAAELDDALTNRVNAITSSHRQSWATNRSSFERIAEIA